MTIVKKVLNEYRIWLVSVLAFLIVPIMKPAFLSMNNIEGILASMITYGVVALGLAMTCRYN